MSHPHGRKNRARKQRKGESEPGPNRINNSPVRFVTPSPVLLGRLILLAAIAAGLMPAAEFCVGLHALRAESREWSDFPAQVLPRLECRLDSPAGARTLVLRQDDVKRSDWQVAINGRMLGALVADEHRQMRVFAIPEGTLQASGNLLTIGAGASVKGNDDIRIDRISTHEPAPEAWLAEAHVHVRVTDDSGRPLPARITLADAERTLLPIGAKDEAGRAVRTGTVYAVSGQAEIPLPAGDYSVWASRGFEYSAAKEEIRLSRGERREIRLRLKREVSIPGWTAGDTHLHTRERSGHGDTTVAERVVSIAGEGLDWAVSTEHNSATSFPDPEGRFVAIPGLEMTTAKGHFNVFPWPLSKSIPDPKAPWTELWRGLHQPDGAVIVWNHPRDSHSGYTPFAAQQFIAVAGEHSGPHPFGGNAMEVVNSGAMYSHPLDLARDWMRLLNRGRQIAAVGSSDSHTVTTFFAGQARTYVRTGTGKPTGQSVAAAIDRGETAVCYGLLTFLEQQGERLVAKIYGPSWSRAQRLLIYANGELIAERKIEARGGGLQWTGEIKPPAKAQDAFLVAIATGGDVDVPFWPISRPYQPLTPDWQPMTLGVSSALRWDGDGDGIFHTPRQQAEALVSQARTPSAIAAALGSADVAVAAQVGLLLAPKDQLTEVLAEKLPAGSREVLQQVGTGWAATKSNR